MTRFISLRLSCLSQPQPQDRLTTASGARKAALGGDARFPGLTCARADINTQGKEQRQGSAACRSKAAAVHRYSHTHRGVVGAGSRRPSCASGSSAQHRADAGRLRGTQVFQRGLSVPGNVEKQNGTQRCSGNW